MATTLRANRRPASWSGGTVPAGLEENRLGEKDYLWLETGLRAIGLFAELTLKNLATILPYIRLYRCPKGTLICREGDPGDRIYLIYKGKVDVLKATGIFEGTPFKLATLSSGKFFGEMSLLFRQPRAASCVAKAESLLFSLSFEDFERVVHKHKEILQHLRRVAVSRMKGGH